MSALSSEQARQNKLGKSKLWIATRNEDLCRLFFAVMLAYDDSSVLIRRSIYNEAKRDLCKRFDMSSKAFNEVIRRENRRRERLGLATVKTERMWGGFTPKARELRWSNPAKDRLADRPALAQEPACAGDTDPAEA